jgi:DNA processing protein
MNADLLHQIALTLIKNIGAVQAKILLDHYENAAAIFGARMSDLEKIEGIGTVRAKSIKHFKDYTRAEEEIIFIEKYQISPLFITDKKYPQRLLNCYDPPTLLYYKGSADLNASKIVSVVGTRSYTSYGKQFTENLIHELSEIQILIVSGLAYGIDTIAHKSAIKNELPTIGVVGHGLDIIYPYENKNLAKEMVNQNGGILTQFTSKTKPDKHHFPIRNRIVAGLADATVIIETSVKGGSMITAEMANGYNRDVFAVPGRVTDAYSAGTNYLIANNKAILLTHAQQLIELMGWEEKKNIKIKKQRELFLNLTTEEKIIINILNEKDNVHIDEINIKSGIHSSSVAAAILNLEFQNVIKSLPGKMYALYD